MLGDFFVRIKFLMNYFQGRPDPDRKLYSKTELYEWLEEKIEGQCSIEVLQFILMSFDKMLVNNDYRPMKTYLHKPCNSVIFAMKDDHLTLFVKTQGEDFYQILRDYLLGFARESLGSN